MTIENPRTYTLDLMGGPRGDIPFRAVFIPAGDPICGQPARPVVGFHDLRYGGSEWPNGQPVSRYYVATLLDHGTGGLNLDGGVPDWTLDAAAFALVVMWARNIAAPLYAKGHENLAHEMHKERDAGRYIDENGDIWQIVRHAGGGWRGVRNGAESDNDVTVYCSESGEVPQAIDALVQCIADDESGGVS